MLALRANPEHGVAGQVKDTGQVQVEAVLLVSPLIPANDLLD